MSVNRQQQLARLFEQALKRSEPERAAFVKNACGEDAELRAELESLLKHDHHADAGFLQPLSPTISTDESQDQTLAAPPTGSPDAGKIADANVRLDADPLLMPRNAPDSADRASGHFPPIDGYEILRKLHQGGQGVVYQAVEKATKRKVAIKVLLEGPYASDHARKRFEREIELVAQLRHPNIISVFHSGITPDGRQFCVMDYVRGIPLNAFVREQKLPLEEALKLFIRVCDAVNYAHQKGVIHRDLKPSNILVDSEGSPRVLDFGLAKLIGAPEQTVVSMTGQVVGTLPYLSPEQARGNPDEIDTRTDVYALGVILYELLTGHYPYPVVGQMAEVLRHIASTEPTPPSRSWKADSGVGPRVTGRKSKLGVCPIDDEVQTIVLRALTKERERRYQSAGELAKDVGLYLSGEAIEAKRDSGWYLVRMAMRRHRRGIATWGGLVLLVIAASGAASYRYIARHNENVRAEANEKACADLRDLKQQVFHLRKAINSSDTAWTIDRLGKLEERINSAESVLGTAEKKTIRPVNNDQSLTDALLQGSIESIYKPQSSGIPTTVVPIGQLHATSRPGIWSPESLESALSAQEAIIGAAETATTKPSKPD